MSKIELNKSHLDMAEEIAKALRKWIQYRLDEKIPSKTISLEINQAAELIVKSILNPTCGESNKK